MNEEPVPVRRVEIPQLSSVRFPAAIWVMLYHFQFMIFGLAPELRPAAFLFNAGYRAVDLFFVLSGYILSYQYLRAFPGGRGPYRRFMIKRFARIYPLMFVTTLLTIIVIVTGMLLGVHIPYPQSFTVWGAIQDFLLIRGWEPFPHQGWNFPGWSLSAEWFAYLLFPLVALLIGAARRQRPMLLLVIAACVVLESLGAWLLPSFNGMPHPLVRVIAGFVAGAAIFAIGTPRIRGVERGGLFGIVGVVGLVLLIVVPDPANPALRGLLALLLAAVTVTGLAHGSGPAIHWLQGRHLVYGGRISYGIYLIHGIVLMSFTALFVGLSHTIPQSEALQWPLIVRIGILLVPLSLVLVLGALSHHLVERPAQRWISGFANRPRTVSAPARLQPAPLQRAESPDSGDRP